MTKNSFTSFIHPWKSRITIPHHSSKFLTNPQIIVPSLRFNDQSVIYQNQENIIAETSKRIQVFLFTTSKKSHITSGFFMFFPRIEKGRKRCFTVDGSEILHHLGCKKPCKQWVKLPTSTGDCLFSNISVFKSCIIHQPGMNFHIAKDSVLPLLFRIPWDTSGTSWPLRWPGAIAMDEDWELCAFRTNQAPDLSSHKAVRNATCEGVLECGCMCSSKKHG